MTDHHQLHNVRRGPNTVPDDTAVPVCSQCGIALHLVPLEGIRTGTRTWCSDACYRVFIDESAAQAVRDHTAARDRARSQAATARAVAAGESQTYVAPKQKGQTRQVAETGAHVVGFILWLIVVSAIAAVIYWVTGIDSTR